ncbi:MAG: hypothetical protein ACTSO4_18325, partial [Promethearchaeota archaeon]
MTGSKRSIYLIYVSVLFFSSAAMTIIVFIPLFLQYLGIDRVQIQLITTIFPFSSSLFPPFIGKFSDKVQNRGYFFKV